MRTALGLLLVTVLGVLLVAAARADASGWELLGQRKVNHQADRDVIHVTVSEGLFRKIKVDVLHNGIELVDLKVYFANGGVQDIPVRRFIERGGETRVIDLTGGARGIRKVQFVYRSRGASPRRATVRLWGLH
jgi:hypothetical protein